MLKSIFIVVSLATAGISSAAISVPNETQAFVHDGVTYTYTVEQKANSRVLRGIAGKSGEPFVLYVSDRKITGTVNGHYVSFKPSEVKPLVPNTQVASR
jgi:hypothetical protein